MVWMIIAGPALVVVAAFITLYLAITIPDPVLPTEALNPRNAIENQQKLDAAMAPAIQARNHAATGVVPAKQKSSTLKYPYSIAYPLRATIVPETN